jgi:hypothetical protein
MWILYFSTVINIPEQIPICIVNEIKIKKMKVRQGALYQRI